MGWITGIVSFVSALRYILEIGVQIFKLLREAYERQERAKVAKEIRDAIKESRETLDNSRLINILDPSREPYPRKLQSKEDSGV